MTPTSDPQPPRWRRIGFYAAVVASLAIVSAGGIDILAFSVVGWLDAAQLESVFPGGELHRVHGLGHGFLFWVLALSTVAQLVRARAAFAAAVLGLAVVVLYTLAAVISGIFDGLELVAVVTFGATVWLHPARDWDAGPIARRAALLAAPFVVGAVLLAIPEVGRQVSGTAADPHVAIGHYGIVAALALSLAFAATVGVSSLGGRQVAAVLAVGCAVAFGIASVLFPDSASSLGTGLGVATIVVAVVYGVGAMSAGTGQPAARVAVGG